MLLRGSVGNELRREKLSERRILLAPPELGELDHHVGFRAHLRGTRPLEPAPRVTAVQDQMTHAFRMADRVCDCNGRPLRNAEQRKAPAAACLDHRFEIAHPRFKRKLGVPIRQATTARVVTDERVVAR